MSTNVSDENVSEDQREYLDMARQSSRSAELFQIIYRVVSDTDVTSGREDLHPDWVSLFEQHNSELDASRRTLGYRLIGELRDFFSSLQTIDPLVKGISPMTENVVFLLGAGASKPSPSNIPTVAELLPEMLNRARRLDREQVTRLADFCDDKQINNIEDLLTAVQISAFCSRNPEILSLVEFQLFGTGAVERPRRLLERRSVSADVSSVAYMQDTLQVLFGLLSNLMLPAKPNKAHQAMAEYISDKPTTPIVTTNYDCCIDLALIGNDVPFSYTVDFVNPDVLANASTPACHLIKLHGSLNWFYCETCQEVRLINIRQTVEEYTNQRGEYPIISVCNECGGQKRGLLVPPHAMKFDIAPPLQPLIAGAASIFERGTLIVVVGFSFAEADLYIARMLTKAMQASHKTKMVIVDPDARVVEKVRRKFESQIPNFDAKSRILKLQGDCSEVLPDFLMGRLSAAPQVDESEGQSDDPRAITPA